MLVCLMHDFQEENLIESEFSRKLADLEAMKEKLTDALITSRCEVLDALYISCSDVHILLFGETHCYD